MRVPLALENLKHQPTRTAVAMAGVGFALLLIFMQLGFFGAVQRTATLLYEGLDFDVMLLSSQYIELNQPDTVAGDRLRHAAADPDVSTVVPLGVNFGAWKVRAPDRPEIDQTRRTLLLVGFDPRQPPFRVERFGEPRPDPQVLDLATDPGSVLIDTRTRDEFGERGVGTRTELGGVIVEVRGEFTLGTGFGADGLAFASFDTYKRVIGLDPRERPTFGLIRLEPGADAAAVAERLNQRLPPDVRAVTRAELFEREQRHWVESTSVGIIFRIGVFVAIIVGVVFVYQVMAGDISNHLPEYATLKAIGYGNGYLTSVVLQQAVILAVFGYVPGLLAAVGFYAIARPNGIPAYMTFSTALTVLLLGIGMCTLSGLLAVRKAKQADPAELF